MPRMPSAASDLSILPSLFLSALLRRVHISAGASLSSTKPSLFLSMRENIFSNISPRS
jgi:hypothetical protein